MQNNFLKIASKQNQWTETG